MEWSGYGKADSSSAGKKFDHLNNILQTVQTVQIVTNEHIPPVLPVCQLLEATYTFHVHSLHAVLPHSATPSTPSIATPTQSADSGLSVLQFVVRI
jgi:hypothetical protein